MQDDVISAGEAARRLGVSPATVQRWVESGRLRAVRTKGGHRRIPVADVFRLASARQPLLAVEGRWRSLLLQGDARSIEGELLASRALAVSWSAVLSELSAAIAELGNAWESGEQCVYQEHVATEAVRRALAYCMRRIIPRDEAPVAALFTPLGERHTLGLSISELILSEHGWNTKWIGEGLPAEEIEPMIRAINPNMILISATPYLGHSYLASYEHVLAGLRGRYPGQIFLAGGARWASEVEAKCLATFEDLDAALIEIERCYLATAL